MRLIDNRIIRAAEGFLMDAPICRKLASLRAGSGLTQEEVANHLGVTKAAVSKWECEQNMPDISLLPSIAIFTRRPSMTSSTATKSLIPKASMRHIRTRSHCSAKTTTPASPMCGSRFGTTGHALSFFA